MEYTVNKLALLSGVSSRSLRYYDEIGLLKPKRISSNGYRIYGSKEVDLLQQILFYRYLKMPLNEIKALIYNPDFNRITSLDQHLCALKQQQQQITALIATLEQTICAAKGEITMSDQEKFTAFKQQLIADNEQQFGEELRQKYDAKQLEESNAILAGMSKEDFELQQTLNAEIGARLRAALAANAPEGEDAQEACRLHRQWLCMFWPKDTYSAEAHRNLAEMYVLDERFKAYYEDLAGVGAAEMLRDALAIYTS